MGRRRRKRIIIIKEIQKSDTFFIFTNTADIISKTNIFVWLLRKLLYLPCFSLIESILGGLMLILEQQRPKEQRPRISTFDNTFTGDLPTPPQLPFSPSINQPTFFLPASEQSLSTEQVQLSLSWSFLRDKVIVSNIECNFYNENIFSDMAKIWC